MYIAIIILQYILATILLFGAFLVSIQRPISKERRIFISMLVVFSVVFIVDSTTIMLHIGGIDKNIYPLDLNYIATGIVSQLYMHWVFYNLLFSIKRSTKLILMMAIPSVLLCLAIWGCEAIRISNTYQDIESLDRLWENIGSPAVYLRLAILFIQLCYSATILITSHTIVPTYQDYIYKNESNDSHNILWVKELAKLYLIITVVYITNAIIFNPITNIIYFVVVIIPFARMIFMILDYRSISIVDDLYDKLNIRWSLRRLCYIVNRDELTHQIDSTNQNREYFKQVDSWLRSEKPYESPEFSFADVTKQFEGINYNKFNSVLEAEDRGNFQSYIRDLRIQDAIDQIVASNGRISFKEIAYRVGFENSSSFSRAFKSVMGVTASEWRSNLVF